MVIHYSTGLRARRMSDVDDEDTEKNQTRYENAHHLPYYYYHIMCAVARGREGKCNARRNKICLHVLRHDDGRLTTRALGSRTTETGLDDNLSM